MSSRCKLWYNKEPWPKLYAWFRFSVICACVGLENSIYSFVRANRKIWHTPVGGYTMKNVCVFPLIPWSFLCGQILALLAILSTEWRTVFISEVKNAQINFVRANILNFFVCIINSRCKPVSCMACTLQNYLMHLQEKSELSRKSQPL